MPHSTNPGGVHVIVAPSVTSPRGTVRATVTTDSPIRAVSSVGVEWGYTNFYRYRWIEGHGDRAERETEDWVGITRVDLPVTDGEFSTGSSTFRAPSWAPGSSPLIARWSCKVTLKRVCGDDVIRGDFQVITGSADVPPVHSHTERIDGPAATDIDIVLPSSIYRAGSTVSGRVTLTPHTDLPDSDVGMCWQRHRSSHPLVRPAAAVQLLDGPITYVGKGIELRAGTPAVLPFALPLPEDAAPSASAVHSSLRWFVIVRMAHPGSTGQLRAAARRAIVVVNTP